MKWLGIILMAALLAGAPGYGSAEQQAQPGTAPVTQPKGLKAEGGHGQAVKSYTPQEKEKYQKKIAADLEEIQQRSDDLKVKGRNVARQKKRTFLRAMVDLQRKLTIARNKLADLEKAPENAWSWLKAETDKAMAEAIETCDGVDALLK